MNASSSGKTDRRLLLIILCRSVFYRTTFFFAKVVPFGALKRTECFEKITMRTKECKKL